MKSFDEDITKRIHERDQGALQKFFFEALTATGKKNKKKREFTNAPNTPSG